MRVLVSGCSSALGGQIAELLSVNDIRVTRAARRPFSGEADLKLDLLDEATVRRVARGHDAAVLAPILTVAAPAARWLAEEGVGRIVVFSSNNVGIDTDAEVYRALARSEASLRGSRAEVTILRPTMIYGHPADGNLARLLGFARRFGFLPCPGDGQALQQPVHVSDVAAAAVQAVLGPFGRGPFSVGGPEVVTTGALFGQVLRAASKDADRVWRVPLAPLRIAARSAEALGLRPPLGTAQLRRILRDKTATEPAPFGYIPQICLPEGLDMLAAEVAAAPRRR